MLLQATNIIPSTFAGVGAGTVDVTQSLSVSWQVNGSTPMTAYTIKICKNDAASTELYSTGVVALSSPFYGTDYLGNTQRFAANVITAETLSTAGIVNGFESGYKLYVIQYSGNQGAYKAVEPYSPAYFITRLAPTVSIVSMPETISEKKLTLAASAQNASANVDNSIEWVRWQWALADNTDDPFYDTGKIYGTSDLKSSYDGLFDGNTYAVKCTIFTECGQEATTGWQTFGVSYTKGAYYGSVKACNTKGTNAITVFFPGATPILGVATGEYSYFTNPFTGYTYLILDADSQIEWNKVGNATMNFAKPWSFVWKGSVRQGSTITAFSINSGDTVISAVVSPRGVAVRQGSSVIAYFSQPNDGNGMRKYTIVIEPSRISLKYRNVYGLYPLEDLYPSETLYPYIGNVEDIKQTLDVDYEQGSFGGVTIYGEQPSTDYIWVTSGALSDEAYRNVMGGESGYKPVFDGDTYMLADFTHKLNAGAIPEDGVPITSLSVYRLRAGESVLKHIAELPADSTVFRDYGACNGETYQYYVFPSSESGDESKFASNNIVSNKVSPCCWDWALLVCSADSSGYYHVEKEYLFGCNVASGDVGNGNVPTWLTNFTKYQTRQTTSVNSLSGTLSALIGRVNQYGYYSDTKELAKELYALSNSALDKFLKDRKGNLYKVEISAEIRMSAMDATVMQAKTIQLPWREVGDASDAAIITTEDDAFFSEVQ